MVQKCNYIVPSKIAFKQDSKVTMSGTKTIMISELMTLNMVTLHETMDHYVSNKG